MPRIKEYGPPADMLARLPAKTIVTKGDKLALLHALQHRAGTSLLVGTDRVTFAAIIADVRAGGRPQRDSAPVQAGALSNPDQSSEGSASIPASVLERKIDIVHGVLQLRATSGQLVATHDYPPALVLTPDQADQLAHALAELADDVRQDVAARAWSQELLATTTE